MKNKTHWIIFLGSILAFIVGKQLVGYDGMSSNWVAPYLSAAANLEWGGDFLIDIEECKAYKELSPEAQMDYHFSASTEPTRYNHNPVGYAYFVKTATVLFPFLGDEVAIQYLQLLLHILFCVFILSQLKDNKLGFYIFLFGYLLNPILLRFASFNFYYFWQTIPSLLILSLLITKKHVIFISVLFALIMPFILCTRMTMILSIGVLFFLIKYRGAKVLHWITILGIFIAIFSAINKPTEKNLYHTIYVGIGAYENDYVQTLSDNIAYDLYEEYTGEKLDARIGENYYDTDVIRAYQKITKEEVHKIVKASPLLFIRNIIYNNLQLFPFGYLTFISSQLRIILILIGALFLGLLLYTKKYITILLIGIPSVTFTFFYPPIPAYMLGSYVFLLLGVYQLLMEFKKRFFSKEGKIASIL